MTKYFLPLKLITNKSFFSVYSSTYVNMNMSLASHLHLWRMGDWQV